MKFLLLLFSTLQFSHAATGVIRALEVPLLLQENDNSKILQTKRMGEKIHIHDNSLNSASEYYITVSRDGMNAYVKKEYIKILFNNISELESKIYLKDDPTDYRTEEPMPNGYPFKSENTMKASLYANYASATSDSYEYVTNKTREQYSPILSLSIKYLKAPSYDNTNRIYYGFLLGGQTERNEFQLKNNIFTQEDNTKFYIGSSFQYTFYRRRYFEIDIGVDGLINYHRSFIGQENATKETYEERFFSGYFVSLKSNVFFIHKDAFDKTNLDIFHGPNLTINSPYTLNASKSAEISELWPSDSINIGMDISFGYMLGFTIRY